LSIIISKKVIFSVISGDQFSVDPD